MMKHPADLTIAELKIMGPAAVRHAAIADNAYEFRRSVDLLVLDGKIKPNGSDRARPDRSDDQDKSVHKNKNQSDLDKLKA
jgi:hypothetical protein